jgi:hypothetical protein
MKNIQILVYLICIQSFIIGSLNSEMDALEFAMDPPCLDAECESASVSRTVEPSVSISPRKSASNTPRKSASNTPREVALPTPSSTSKPSPQAGSRPVNESNCSFQPGPNNTSYIICSWVNGKAPIDRICAYIQCANLDYPPVSPLDKNVVDLHSKQTRADQLYTGKCPPQGSSRWHGLFPIFRGRRLQSFAGCLPKKSISEGRAIFCLPTTLSQPFCNVWFWVNYQKAPGLNRRMAGKLFRVHWINVTFPSQ